MDTLRFAYPARLARDEAGRLLVTFRDLPEAGTDGTDRAEALLEAEDCLEEAIAGRIWRGDPIPFPSAPRARDVLVVVPAVMAAKAALYTAARDAGVTNVALARELGIDEKEVRRLLDPAAASKLPRVLAAINALGRRLVVELEADGPRRRAS